MGIMKQTPQQRYDTKFKKKPMTAPEFKNWMLENRLSIPDAAMYFGISIHTVINYCEGKSKISHPVVLACELYELQNA